MLSAIKAMYLQPSVMIQDAGTYYRCRVLFTRCNGGDGQLASGACIMYPALTLHRARRITHLSPRSSTRFGAPRIFLAEFTCAHCYVGETWCKHQMKQTPYKSGLLIPSPQHLQCHEARISHVREAYSCAVVVAQRCSTCSIASSPRPKLEPLCSPTCNFQYPHKPLCMLSAPKIARPQISSAAEGSLPVCTSACYHATDF
jgi:hypothetical protein